MGAWIMIGFVFFVIVTVILLTIFLSYYKKAYQCDSAADIFCYTDWLCDAGMNTQQYGPVAKEEMSCFLKSLYSSLTDADIAPGGPCAGFVNRGQACSDPDDPTQTNACTNGNVTTTGYCGCNPGVQNNALWSNGCDLTTGCSEASLNPGALNMATVACGIMAQYFSLNAKGQDPCAAPAPVQS